MRSVSFLASLLVLFSSGPALAATDRLNDRELRAILERIDDGRDHLEDSLDGHMKKRIMRGPAGEFELDHYLFEFRDAIADLRVELADGHAANAEAATVLRQASSLDAFFRTQPLAAVEAAEWARVVGDLKTLARNYLADFPLPADATVGRLNDRGVVATADHVARTAKQFRQMLDDELDRDPRVDKRSRDAIVGETDRLEQMARDLRDRVDDGQPSSGDLDRLLAQAARVGTALARCDAPAAKGIWTRIAAPLQALAGAYHAPWPPQAR